MDPIDRRLLLTGAGIAGIASTFGGELLAQTTAQGNGISTESAPRGPVAQAKYRVPFAVIGLDHAHIYSMTDALIRGGGVLTAFYAADPGQIATFRKRYGDVKLARDEAEILEDRNIKLVAGAPIPDLRAPLGVRVMRAGKDYLSDKPAITTLGQLADVRRAIKETGRKFAIMYSERLEVPAAVMAGQLVDQGAIGKVVQTINIAPHRVSAPTRPAWFWDKARYGGILTDIGSHQADQFVYFTRSTQAHVVASQTGNLTYPQHPDFEDFGDMTMTGNGGTGYVRVDWFTPDGLPTWGDGRLFLLGTEGYIELRKYVDVAGRPGGNHLFVADKKGVRYLDCKNVFLPFGPQFVTDIVERTSVAQDQAGALLAAELVLTAQKNATRPVSA
ncbi:Gfo/Idh/MocA family protein [Sphingomonas crusticola]|uniref:Gfo/Idh/MocA family protein n=1 Tax=Sphingomonas crusticola TaxID=1697973 RepID=UPI000E23286E|nr:Gfo/Idh/MocA family oxidoreductase [Sphingomonas crusticola]